MIASLKEAILQRRRGRLGTSTREITHVTLLRQKDKDQMGCEKNLSKIKSISQLDLKDELFVSFKMTPDLKYKPANHQNKKLTHIIVNQWRKNMIRSDNKFTNLK